MLARLHIWLCCVLMCGNLSAISAITADFTVNQQIGCVPFVAQFSDISAGGNIVYHHWSFGNGNHSYSNASVVSAAYTVAGTYTVTLTVSDGLDTATITKNAFVEVHNIPKARIALQNVFTGCAPFTLNTIDSSSISGSSIITYEWSFDDGTPNAIGKNISHTFNYPGSYDLSLIVVDSVGCQDAIVLPNAIQVMNPPIASFENSNSSNTCIPPFPVNLTNTSTGSGLLNSTWTINGQQSNFPHLSTQLLQFGAYDVELIVTDSAGCADTLSQVQFLKFDSANFQILSVDTVCKGIPFTLTTLTNYNDSVWMRCDTVYKNGANNTFSFQTGGMKSIWVYGRNNDGCIDSASKNIWVDQVEANFGISATYSCQVPFTVSYTDSSIGAVTSFEYRLGAAGKNPTIKIPNPTITVNSEGVFSDTMIVTSNFGCKDTSIIANNLKVHLTKAIVTPDVISGCAPLTVNFTNSSLPIDSVASVNWDYDDNSPVLMSLGVLNSSHTFYTPGEYKVKMRINTFSGCYDSVITTILVGSPQTANFNIGIGAVCASDLVTVQNLSSDTSLINSYLWDFGDGYTDTSANTSHQFQDTGWLNVSLIVGYNGCMDTITLDSSIFIKGPVINFEPTINCGAPNEVTFIPSIKGGHVYEWNYGNGIVDSSFQSHVHSYIPSDSTYLVRFFSKDTITGCTNSVDKYVHVRFLQAHVTAPISDVCKGDFVGFDASGTVNGEAYRWRLNNGSWKDASVNKYFGLNKKGVNTVYMAAKDINGCMDTSQVTITTHRPEAKFGIQQLNNCKPINAQFFDSTITDAGILNQLWNFGNGNTSNLPSPIEVFSGASGSQFTISYTVSDTFGCSDSYTIHNGITINHPEPNFSIMDTTLCFGDSLEVIHNHDTSLAYLWDFGDGSQSGSNLPRKQYMQQGVFGVSLTLTNLLGCDSTFGPLNVLVHNIPNANFDTFDSNNTCFPADVKFKTSVFDSNVVKWVWNFGDSPQQVTLNADSAFNQYNQIGYYDVSLTVENSFGCTSNFTKPHAVSVTGPYAILQASPEGCIKVGQQVNFKADSVTALAHNLIWDFGDGVVSSTLNHQQNQVHHYNQQGKFLTSLIASDSSKSCFFSSTDTVTVSQYNASILASTPNGCVPLNLGALASSVNSSRYEWYLDSFLVGQKDNVNLVIDQPGVHGLTVVVWNDSVFCPDTAFMQIQANEPLEVNLSENQKICKGESAELNVDQGYTYRWWSNSQSAIAPNYQVLVSPAQSAMYYVEVNDGQGCQQIDSVFVEVNSPIELKEFQQDTSLLPTDEMLISAKVANYAELNWEAYNVDLSCYDCLNPYLSYPNSDEVFLHITGLSGCPNVDTSFSVVSDQSFTVFLPNAFTPSGDGLNDEFKVQGIGIIGLEYFYIYDRWGDLVFESTHLDQGWNGKINNKPALANQMYTYKVKAIGPNNITKTLVGAVTVITKQ